MYKGRHRNEKRSEIYPGSESSHSIADTLNPYSDWLDLSDEQFKRFRPVQSETFLRPEYQYPYVVSDKYANTTNMEN